MLRQRLGGGVDRQPRAGLHRVREQGRAAADDGGDRAVEGVGLAGQEDADHGPGRGPDDGRDRVPGRVDVGDLVGDELHRVEEPGHRQHVPAPEHVGDLRGVVEVVGDAEHEHDEVAVQAARPAAGEDKRGGPRARQSARSWAMAVATESGSRPITVVPSAAVMIGRWSARVAARPSSQSSRWSASRGKVSPSSAASFAGRRPTARGRARPAPPRARRASAGRRGSDARCSRHRRRRGRPARPGTCCRPG